MNKYYVSFGQVHVHSVNGKTFDKDCLAEMQAYSYGEAREKAFEIFKGIFHNVYEEKDLEGTIQYFPRGIIKVY